MALLRESIQPWFLAVKELCLQVVCHGGDFVTANRKQWAAGSMAGLSVAASILLSSPEIPLMFSFGAIVVLIPSAWMYSLQNSKEITRYTGKTALTLFAITIFTFHGLGSWRQILDWIPIFLSTTLLTAVNVTPSVTMMITSLGEGLFAFIQLGRSIGPLRGQNIDVPMDEPMDVERTTGTVAEMSEHQTVEYWRFRSIDSIWNFIRGLPDVRILGSQGQGVDESIDLELGSQTTRTDIRALMETLNRDSDLPSPLIELAVPQDEPVTDFPNAPLDLFPRSYSPGSTSRARIEEPNPEHLVPE